MKSFSALLKSDVAKEFVKRAFHITYEKVSNESITYVPSAAVNTKVHHMLSLDLYLISKISDILKSRRFSSKTDLLQWKFENRNLRQSNYLFDCRNLRHKN